ncbi:MAG: type II toxin-antitoxin system RelE/ParE family toxin [Ignavibacteriales bacterium]|nr:type II toxin-antitoxin system RelE/ParE family toxin [Ignavibacteriales bacterium]
MARFKIIFARSASKELEALPRSVVEKIIVEIENLADNPFPKGSKRLKGEKNRWRIRVGDYRIIYSILTKDLIIDIIRIRHRKEAYN